MQSKFFQEYIRLSKEFRTFNDAKRVVGELYDLMYELEKINRCKNDELVLSNVYTLLGFHLSAFESFKKVADLENRKDKSRLFVLQEKAKSHGNNFVTKDLRKLEKKFLPTRLSENDFIVPENNNENIFVEKDILVFNKLLNKDKVKVNIYGGQSFEDFSDKIIDYIFWLGDCKQELIEFYNKEMSQYSKMEANEHWYHLLEVFRINVLVDLEGNICAEVVCGDSQEDHLLDIEIENDKVVMMNYDG